jgi:hypothetical protein
MGTAADTAFARTALLSLAPLADPGWRRANLPTLARRAAIGVVLWLAALHLHATLVGISPFPAG